MIFDLNEHDTFNREQWDLIGRVVASMRGPRKPSAETLEGSPWTRPLRGRDADVSVPLIGAKQ